MEAPPARWRTPEELVRTALLRSRLVLVNEAHDGLRRCIRTRRIGVRMVREAHAMGVRHLAMEALFPRRVAAAANRAGRLPEEQGYLGQPEMRELVHCALGLGWTLVSYEADLERRPAGLPPLSLEETNWRERQRARNLCAAQAALPARSPLMVWCGNGHLRKRPMDGWRPMGSLLQTLCGVEPFCIDQTVTVRFRSGQPVAARWQRRFGSTLRRMRGTAGFLAEEAPAGWPHGYGADAYLLSLDNALS